MKRFFSFIIAMTLFFIITVNTVYAEDYYFKDEEKTFLVDQLITSEGGVSSEDVNSLSQVVAKVDSKVLQAMVNTNWQICLTGSDIASSYTNGEWGSKIRGITIYDLRTIYIEPRAILDTPIHEIGHFILWYLDFPVDSDEFYDIYYDEVETFKSRIINPGCVSSVDEFFCESFYYMYEDSSLCTPRVVDFIQRNLDSF